MELTARQIESIAIAIHEDYRKNNPRSRFDMPWDSLPEDIRQSNRDQAGELTGYIDLLGLTVCACADGKNAEHIEQLADAQIETVARHIHEVWMKSKEAAGWVYGRVRDDEKKFHPMLVPYDELEDAEKEKDRAIAGNIAPLLKIAGLAVRR